MESNTLQEMKVGIFVAVGTIALAISIIMFGGDSLFLTRTYKLRAILKDVQGLAPGSIVSLSGLTVGNVKKIHFEPKTSALEVVMDIEYRHRDRITTDATASVRTQGALGDRYIYIEPNAMIGEVLKDGDMLKTLEKGDLFDVLNEKGSELSRILDIVKEFHILMKNINLNNRSGQLMDSMIGAADGMQKMSVDTRKTMDRMNSILAKIDRGDGTLGALINDPSLHNRLMTMFGDSPRNQFLKPLIRQSIQTSEKQK